MSCFALLLALILAWGFLLSLITSLKKICSFLIQPDKWLWISGLTGLHRNFIRPLPRFLFVIFQTDNRT